MTGFDGELDRFEEQLAALETGIGGLQNVTVTFRRELDSVEASMKRTGREAAGMSRSVSSSVQKAFEGVVFDGKRLSEAVISAGRSVSGSVLHQAIAPVRTTVGSWVGNGIQSIVSDMMSSGNGAAQRTGRIAAFARGGVVNGPSLFPMGGSTGLMGEAGPEAILPLARGSDGRLGIRSGGGGGAVNITMNISTPDATSFRRSQSQIASEMSRAMRRGQRNL